MWALWYALAHPDRVQRLVLQRAHVAEDPLPAPRPGDRHPRAGAAGVTVGATQPDVGAAVRGSVGEKGTLAGYPDLVDLLVAALRDPVTDRAAMAEFHALISPFALMPSGFRRRSRVRPDEPPPAGHAHPGGLGRAGPGRQHSGRPGGHRLIPDARLELLPTGHGPWLGQPTPTAAAVADFVLPLQ